MNRKELVITVLFGAGASQAFSEKISTKTITEAIRDMDNWRPIIAKVAKQIPVSETTIKKTIKEVKYATQKENNFERIIEIIDRVCGYHCSIYPNENLFGDIIRIIRRKGPIKSLTIEQLNSYQITPFLVREVVAQHLINALTEEGDTLFNELSNLQHSFISALKKDSKAISLISLNYDSILAKSIGVSRQMNSLSDLGFITGFRAVGKSCDYVKLLSSFFSVIYPHGSLFFQRVQNNRINYYEDIAFADKCRFDCINGLFPSGTIVGARGDFGYDFNSFMVTGKTKEVSMSSEPWDVFYMKAINDLTRRNDFIIIIGYSFSDGHYNSALKYSIESGHTKAILIIDYKETLLYDEVVSGPLYNIFHKHAPSFNEAAIYAAIKTINRDGYGFLFDNIYYFKDGYRAFLNNYQRVINDFIETI